jgi:hypothetical protein
MYPKYLGELGLSTLLVLVLALVVRLASLPLLLRAQQSVRQRALAANGIVAPRTGTVAAVFEWVLGIAGAVGLWQLLYTRAMFGFRFWGEPLAVGEGWDLARATHLSLVVTRIIFLAVGIGLLLLWALLGVLTQRNLLTGGMPEGTWALRWSRGAAADIWAWACCVVCATHGSSPFAATSTGAVIRKIVDSGPEPAALASVQALDPALAAVVARALTMDPAGRPADGAALLDLLTDYRGAAAAEAVRGQITQGWRTLAL